MGFGNRLKEKRKFANFTQSKLAASVGVSTRTIQNYESGNRNPSNLIIVQRLADILGTTTEYLLDCPESFAAEIKKEDGAKAVPDNIHDLVEKITELFTAGNLGEDTLDDAMKTLSDAYWAAKEKTSVIKHIATQKGKVYSTVTLLAKFRGLSTSRPRATLR